MKLLFNSQTKTHNDLSCGDLNLDNKSSEIEFNINNSVEIVKDQIINDSNDQ